MISFGRSFFEPAFKRLPDSSRDLPEGLQATPRTPKCHQNQPNWTIFRATTRHEIGESPVLYYNEFESQVHGLGPETTWHDPKRQTKNWRESCPAFYILSDMI